jgi:hypothetical protein
MNFQQILIPVGGIALVAYAWYGFGWGGVALAVGGIVMWMLLHFTRMTQVLSKAGERPIGYVDSAVMLNARLKPKLTLLHVVGLTRALGEQLSEKDAQPEIYRWTDAGNATVTCEFANGRLMKWTFTRPAPEAEPAPAAADEPPR